ncbi:ABC transporter permease [Herbaspirillum sp. RV1423]|uniref:ABC transporter permease n=1 Tax=Herbaspirillum sp. RV1423 TaxID=1443993 RepID=UPI0004B8EB3A|nr:ABC transporter permease [Herbaspirillum sp. RV1423]
MNTFDFFFRRLIKAAFVVLGVVVLNFLLVHLAPGDPASVMAGESGAGDALFLAQLRAQFGLDQPLYVQLWMYLKGVLTLNLGFSYRNNIAVSALIWDRLPATLLLTASAFIFSLVLGVVLGVMASARRGKAADSLIMSGALLFYATPLFWVSLMSILVFSIYLDWLPPFGMETIGAGLTGFAHVWDVVQHMILPVVTLGLFFTAIYTRLTRAAMLEVASLDFVKTARAKGVPQRQITRRHILRNALLPVFTFASIQAGQILGGAVLTETVFAWPGIGRLMFDALLQRDYPVLLGVFFVTSVMVVLVNLLADLLYRFVDPRIEVKS